MKRARKVCRILRYGSNLRSQAQKSFIVAEDDIRVRSDTMQKLPR